MSVSAVRWEGACPGCDWLGPRRRSSAQAERDGERHQRSCGPPPGAGPQALAALAGDDRACEGCGQVLPLEDFFFLPTLAGEPRPTRRCGRTCLNAYRRIRDEEGERFVRLTP